MFFTLLALGVLFILVVSVIGSVLYKIRKRQYVEVDRAFAVCVLSVLNGAVTAGKYEEVCHGFMNKKPNYDYDILIQQLTATMRYFINDVNSHYNLFRAAAKVKLGDNDVMCVEDVVKLSNGVLRAVLVSKLNPIGAETDSRGYCPLLTVQISPEGLTAFINSINKQIDAKKLRDLLCL